MDNPLNILFMMWLIVSYLQYAVDNINLNTMLCYVNSINIKSNISNIRTQGLPKTEAINLKYNTNNRMITIIINSY